MIKIDVSKAIPQRLGTYLLGLIPGLLFESSVAISNPPLAHSMIDRVRQIYPFRPYPLLILFIASCLMTGQAFFLFAWFVDVLIGYGYGLKRYLVRVTFGSRWLYRSFAKMQGFPPSRNIVVRSLSWTLFRLRQDKSSIRVKPIIRCWHLAAKQLLKMRYGIDRTEAQTRQDEWEGWYAVLGKPSGTFQEALMTTRTFLGCGFAGLAALYVSPALRGRFFIPLCAVFALTGCYQSVDLAKWSQDPVRIALARLRWVLLELAETQAVTDKEASRPERTSDVTIDADADPDAGG